MAGTSPAMTSLGRLVNAYELLDQVTSLMPPMSFLEAVSKPREIVRPIGLNGKTET